MMYGIKNKRFLWPSFSEYHRGIISTPTDCLRTNELILMDSFVRFLVSCFWFLVGKQAFAVETTRNQKRETRNPKPTK